MEAPAPPLVGQLGASVPLTCPECGGPIHEIDAGKTVRYRCQVGHAFSASAMLRGRLRGIEQDLWHLISSFEESAFVCEALARQEGRRGPSSAEFRKLAAEARREQIGLMRIIQRAPLQRLGDDFPGAGRI